MMPAITAATAATAATTSVHTWIAGSGVASAARIMRAVYAVQLVNERRLSGFMRH
ncbi:hypothetical protein [Paenarthrobacter aurescens]|uniref:hypothetical protein n=1 Tax=Paenarthrobacter aurescens TaxID=43663 RepID=UPI0021C073ED|nr:hypothetical protein [Paenarthrobacter aurescens]MCT9871760.1 hypothetical protein [Paenarthrobacter aurescens]